MSPEFCDLKYAILFTYKARENLKWELICISLTADGKNFYYFDNVLPENTYPKIIKPIFLGKLELCWFFMVYIFN